MTNEKTGMLVIMAFVAVLLASVVSASGQTGLDATGSGSVPAGGDYGYVITYGNNNTTIENVQYYDAHGTLQSAMNNGGTGAGSINSFWRFDATTGIGPFNSFYCAVNLADYTSSGAPSEFSTEQPLSKKAGEIAYILKPNNLGKTLAGTDITKTGKYNVMLAVPTVYYYSDGTSKLYMTNDPDFEYFSSTVKENLECYAHTLTLYKNGANVQITYPYLMYGVYEGTITNGKLVSQSTNANPTTGVGYTIKSFRDASVANTASPGSSASAGSQYGIWNFYQWTLYKMMGYTILGSKDAQTQLGAGCVSTNQLRGCGAMDTLSPYYGSPTASKLLIEHAWGGALEFVDNVLIVRDSSYIFKTGDISAGYTNRSKDNNGLSSANLHEVNGLTVPASGWINHTSITTEIWDIPMGTTSSTATGSSRSDYVQRNADVNANLLLVGGYHSSGDNAGLNCFEARRTDTNNNNTGSRLVYLAQAPAVLDTAPTPTDYTYSSEAQALVTGGTATGGTIWYSTTQSGVYSSDVPTGINAGDYTVWVKVKGDAWHYDTEPVEVEGCHISKVSLTIGAPTVAGSRLYDGTTDIAVTPGALIGVVGEEDVTVTAIGSVESKDIGANKTVTIVYTLSGADMGNYIAPVNDTSKAITITAKQLTGINWAEPADLVYSKTAKVPTYTAGEGQGVIAGDAVTVTASVTVADSNVNVGTFTFTATALDNANYSLPANCVSPEYTITPKEIGLEWNAPADLVYSKTAKAPTVDATGVIEGDSVNVTAALTAENDNVSVGNFTFTASAVDNANYKLPDVKVSPEYTITPKEITISGIAASDKVYDKTTVATLVYDGVVYGGIIEGETLTVTANGAFADANVGNGKNVAISDIVLDGASAGNYVLAATGQQTETTAGITQKDIVISGITAQNKPYDGTTAATLVYDGVIYDGIEDGDTLTVTATGTFADADIGAGKTVNISNLQLGGASVANYKLAATGQQTETTASITKTPAVLVTAPTPTDCTYSGEPQALVAGGTATGGTIWYSATQGGVYSADVPTGTDAGDYTVWVMVKGDAEHEDTEPIEILGCHINKANLNLTVTMEDYYMDAAVVDDPVVTGNVSGGEQAIQYKVNDTKHELWSNQAPTTAGSYLVKVTVAATQNYNAGQATSTFTVLFVEEYEEATTDDTGAPVEQSYTVDVTAGDISVSVETTSTDGAVIKGATAQAIVDSIPGGAAKDVYIDGELSKVSVADIIADSEKVNNLIITVNSGKANEATVTFPQGSLTVKGEGEVKLIVTPSAAPIAGDHAAPVDITIVGANTAFNHPVTVQIETDIPADATNIRAYCVDTREYVDADYNGAVATFTAGHFSTWCIVYTLPGAGPVQPGYDDDQLPPSYRPVPTGTSSGSNTATVAVIVAVGVAAIMVAILAVMVMRKS